MTTIRRFCCEDLLKFANVNIDHLTETVRALSVSRFQLTWAGFLAKQSKVLRLSSRYHKPYFSRRTACEIVSWLSLCALVCV